MQCCAHTTQLGLCSCVQVPLSKNNIALCCVLLCVPLSKNNIALCCVLLCVPLSKKSTVLLQQCAVDHAYAAL